MLRLLRKCIWFESDEFLSSIFRLISVVTISLHHQRFQIECQRNHRKSFLSCPNLFCIVLQSLDHLSNNRLLMFCSGIWTQSYWLHWKKKNNNENNNFNLICNHPCQMNLHKWPAKYSDSPSQTEKTLAEANGALVLEFAFCVQLGLKYRCFVAIAEIDIGYFRLKYAAKQAAHNHAGKSCHIHGVEFWWNVAILPANRCYSSDGMNKNENEIVYHQKWPTFDRISCGLGRFLNLDHVWLDDVFGHGLDHAFPHL